jgi:2-polyprenyl-3-methyl-5-hydroxy-6-metoxy-1,4-benzoquinol methylase
MNMHDLQRKPCPLCGEESEFAFGHRVLGRHEAQYAICKSCEFVHAIDPTWLAEAYSYALASTDTGVVERNRAVADALATFAWLSGLSRERGLDIGGGHGLLVRMLRDRGLDFRWSDKHAQNLLARGFEDDGGKYDWLTLVEVFEHLTQPKEFFQEVVERYEPDCIFFTTLLKPAPIPPLDWWYWCFETGQHIGFASKRSLALLASRLGYSLTSAGAFHLLYRHRRHKVAYTIATARYQKILQYFAMRRLHSLTMQDHHALASKLREQQVIERGSGCQCEEVRKI